MGKYSSHDLHMCVGVWACVDLVCPALPEIILLRQAAHFGRHKRTEFDSTTNWAESRNLVLFDRLEWCRRDRNMLKIHLDHFRSI